MKIQSPAITMGFMVSGLRIMLGYLLQYKRKAAISCITYYKEAPAKSLGSEGNVFHTQECYAGPYSW